MTWFPIGPDFVYLPRDAASPQRLSRRNMFARQCQIHGIAADPNNASTIYTVDRDWYPGQPKGGTGAFRTDDGGTSWTAISNSLQQPTWDLNPACIAVHPVVGNYVYLGTTGGAVYTSSNKGDTWGPPATISTAISKIIVDPRNAANPATTTIFAGTATGLFVSTNGGASFNNTPVLPGVVSSMAFSLPAAGTPTCYVGIYQQGIYYSTNPTSAASWAPATGNGLPANGTYHHVWLDYCLANPQRAYCYFMSVQTGTVAVCTTGSGNNQWKKINTNGIPASSGVFAVAPNSPGDGNNDILFVGHLKLARSIDSGQTWTEPGDHHHDDQRSIGFAPPNPPQGTIPMTLVGNDGGLVGSTRAADPTYNYAAVPSDYSDGATYASSGVAQNLNQGKMTAALRAYAADPSTTALGYIGCDDTGLAAHMTSLGWRGMQNGDGDAVACAPGTDGMKVWVKLGFPFFTYVVTDTGLDGPPPAVLCKLGANNIESSSNHVLTTDKKCVTGIMAGPIVRIEQTGTATQISQQSFAPPILKIAASTVDNTLFAGVTGDNRLFITSGVVPGPNTVWTEPTTNKPAGTIASVAIDIAGNIYALMTAIPANSTTPLYKISGGSWTAQASSGLPGLPYGRMIADPVTPSTLYAVAGGRVYKLALGGNTFAWSEVGAGLPGPHVDDLWIGQLAAKKVLLRAAIGGRGIWETDVTNGAVDPPARPYLRDHILDQGWLSPSQNALVNPLRPMDGVSVFHYLSPDIKVDAQQLGSPNFFQTDPEGTLPLSNVLFDIMRDNSTALPGSDKAMCHVQVHNRSYTKLDNVHVWAIYANASGGVPALNASPSQQNNFLFWNQFKANGTIVPSLPNDSPWTSVGMPITLSGIDAQHPRVASWPLTVPPFVNGDPGHYCMAVFVHSVQNPINESSYNVDTISRTNPQIGQKNLHVVLPLAQPLFARIREYVEFHNPDPEARRADLVFDLRGLPPQLHMWFKLSELKTEAPLEESLAGIETIHRPGVTDHLKAALLSGVEKGDELLEWLDRGLHRVEHRLGGDRPDERPCHKPHPGLRFLPTVYRAKPSSLVAVRDVHLPSHGAAAAMLVIENHGKLPPGSEYRFQVQQVVGGRVVGGSTYVIRLDAVRVRDQDLGERQKFENEEERKREEEAEREREEEAEREREHG